MGTGAANGTVAGVAAQKRALRERLIAGRRRRGPPGEAAAAAAAERILATPEFTAAQSLGLYAGLPDELSTRSLERAARAAGKRVAMPRALLAGRLEWVWTASFEELRPGRYGVLEPPSDGPVASLAELDLLVVPGVAFDREGGRLGRGAGYYDRALAGRQGRRPFVVGFAEASQVVDEVPRESFDELVDAVATERELIRRSEPQ